MVDMPEYVGPNRRELSAMLARGLTQQQIVQEWEAKTGLRVARSTISMAMSRWDLIPSRPRENYTDLLPWRLLASDQLNVNARMLRLEARVRRGKKLNKVDERRLRYWRKDLADNDAVVTYDQSRGFRWIKRRPEHSDIIDPPKEKEEGVSLKD